MSDVILVVLTRPETAPALLDAAACLAARIGEARIDVLAPRGSVHVNALAAEVLMDEADTLVAGRGQEQARVAALRATFDQWRAGADENASACWTEAEGNVQAIVGERGSRADIVVATRPGNGDRLMRQAFHAALFGTGRPELMMPPIWPNATMGRRVAVAWRDEKRAVSALLPALRYFGELRQIDLLIGVRAGADSPKVPRVLLEHGIRADLHVLPIELKPFGQTLLDEAHRLSADLLVMGAYAHSPLRELILGGVTRTMLTHADLPVLMRH